MRCRRHKTSSCPLRRLFPYPSFLVYYCLLLWLIFFGAPVGLLKVFLAFSESTSHISYDIDLAYYSSNMVVPMMLQLRRFSIFVLGLLLLSNFITVVFLEWTPDVEVPEMSLKSQEPESEASNVILSRRAIP